MKDAKHLTPTHLLNWLNDEQKGHDKCPLFLG